MEATYPISTAIQKKPRSSYQRFGLRAAWLRWRQCTSTNPLFDDFFWGGRRGNSTTGAPTGVDCGLVEALWVVVAFWQRFLQEIGEQKQIQNLKSDWYTIMIRRMHQHIFENLSIWSWALVCLEVLLLHLLQHWQYQKKKRLCILKTRSLLTLLLPWHYFPWKLTYLP